MASRSSSVRVRSGELRVILKAAAFLFEGMRSPV